MRDVSYLKIDDVEATRELGRVSARIQRFADLFWVSFPEGRGLDGRFTLTKRRSATNSSLSDHADESPALPESDAYRALDNVLHRLETTLDILPDPPSDAESLLRRTRSQLDLNFIVADDRQFVY